MLLSITRAMVWIFGGRNFGEFSESLASGLPNFTIQILTMSLDISIKETNRNLPKFYLSEVSDGKFTEFFLCKLSRYTVFMFN